jgi:membrane dipeptidase
MLHPGWVVGQTTADQVPLARVIDHIDHICQLAGNTRHVGIGTDLDGGYGREQSPGDLDTIVDLQRIPGMLADRGYSESDIESIMHANWLRLFRSAWSAANVAAQSNKSN